jgi:hypothetical protein
MESAVPTVSLLIFGWLIYHLLSTDDCFNLLPLELQEVSSMLLEKLVAAGIGNRPVVFVTHRFYSCIRKEIVCVHANMRAFMFLLGLIVWSWFFFFVLNKSLVFDMIIWMHRTFLFP